MRKDCNYRFCDKTRFVQVTLLGHKGGKDENRKVNKNTNFLWAIGGGWGGGGVINEIVIIAMRHF